MNPALPGMPEMPESEGTLVEGADIWEPSCVLSKDGYAKDTVRAYGESCFAAGRAEASKDAWISVHDRLPELGPDEEGVQVWTWDGEFIENDEFVACYEQPAGPAVGGWMRVGDWFASDLFAAVTHWRPYIKPSPPAATPTKEQQP